MDLDELQKYYASLQNQPAAVDPTNDRWSEPDPELEALKKYAAQLSGPTQPAVDPTKDRWAPQGDPELDALKGYAGQLAAQPAAVDPNVDHGANLGLDFAIPMSDADRAAQVAAKAQGVTTGPVNPNGPPVTVPTQAGTLDVSGFPSAGTPKVNIPAPDQSAFTDAEGAVDRQARVNAINQQAKKPIDLGVPGDLEDTGGVGQQPLMLGGQPTVIPGGHVDILRPEDRQMLTEGQQDKMAALGLTDPDQLAQAHQAAIDRRDNLSTMAYLDQQAVLQGQLDAAQRQQRILAAADKDARDLADKAQKEAADATVDSGHFFASKDAGQQVALVLGSALGAIGSALNNTPNYALQMIQAAMDRDMDAQKSNLANKQKGADSALKRAVDSTGNLQQAEALTRLQQLQVADNTAAYYKGLAQNDEDRAKIDEIRAGLKQGMLDQQGALKMLFAQQNAATYPYRPPTVIGGGGGALPGGLSKDENERVFQDADGRNWVARTPTSREKLASQSATAQTISQIANNINAITAQDGWRTNMQARAQLDSYRTQLLFQVKNAAQLGVLSADDAKLVDKTIGDPTDFLDNGGKIAQRYAQQANIQLKNEIRAQAAEPVARGYTRDQMGGVKPAAVYQGQTPDAAAGKMPPSKPLVSQ